VQLKVILGAGSGPEALRLDVLLRYLGIDPGRKGAFVLIDDKGGLIDMWDMPLEGRVITAHAICGVLKQVYRIDKKPYTVIEKPGVRPTDGKKSIATTHLEAGYLAVFVAWGFPVSWIPPAVWCRSLHVGLSADLSAKKKSLQAFKNQYPDLAATNRFIDGKIVYDGRIDALLIAEFARRLHNGSELTDR